MERILTEHLTVAIPGFSNAVRGDDDDLSGRNIALAENVWEVRGGRYGLFVTDGEANASLPGSCTSRCIAGNAAWKL